MTDKYTFKTSPDGRKEWRCNGKFHRLRGPAVINADGSEEWWLHGKRHRVGRPAIMFKCGTTKWYLDGNLHCLCGPAVINVCGHHTHSSGKCIGESRQLQCGCSWWIQGRPVSEQDYYWFVDTENQELLIPPGRTLRGPLYELPVHIV
jgi:hypothetical protein